MSAAFNPGRLRITHWCGQRQQAAQGQGQQTGQASLLLPWELTTATQSDNQTVPVPGSVLARALRRAESSVCAHAGAAAAIVTKDGPGSTLPRTRWTLNLVSWDETLVDTVDESYSLNVTDSRVEVAAATVWGARHALDSLAQLARTQPDGEVSLSHASVTDEPEYEYRGLMVSPGQRFMTPELLKTTLDAMEIARMNVLHFHLSEFCRYAIESKAFPQLSANLSSGLNKGFYTFDEIHTLVAQAKERGIRVIPEYDVPGHQARNMGVLDEMKWCGSRPPTSGNYQWELFDDPAGSTFGALKKLYTELMGLFPDKFFHVGGDEIAKVGPCTVNGSLHSLEHKILRLLQHNGKTPYGWSELLLVTDGTEGYSDTVLSAWKGGDSNSSVAAITGRGHRCVNSNSTAYYLGWQENYNPDKSPGAPASIGIGISDAYIDIAEGVPEAQKKLLLGGEISIWTDHYTAPTFGEQCGVNKQPLTNPAGKLFPRDEDAAFAMANLGVTFPTSVVAADSWWRFNASLDVTGPEYQARLQKVNAALIAAGVESCPSKCMSLNPKLGGCNETARCGVPIV